MRSKFAFLLAIIMGIITTILFFNYTKQLETEEVVEQETIQVVKASETIPEGQVITTDLLDLVTVTKENIHPKAVIETAEVKGKYAAAVIEQGEILLNHRVKSQQEEKVLVSRKVKPGFRAVSIGTPRVQSVESVTNLIEPEDYVDIVFTEIDENEEVQTEQIFSNIRVLAVGRKMNTPINEQSTYVEYSAVTLEVTPSDAIRLINASNRGMIHFTLHPSIKEEE
ncbi:Flp pilus assembly protein CpaB [Paraliobacillus quinghaiensis]|uniref:Flp pilus assembly protein CpaB n=1 Tax=Paraliobacillus quinghaiensis TaxID=470815 RepID=A0A917TP22_9BACI|nr:Flp pilus assembly protein CpaB [Paraliobacillus quinghaiensis]GGM30615.1 Flp pilus assembly protein CpaB [Paraliobacillus quinghaiensis]